MEKVAVHLLRVIPVAQHASRITPLRQKSRYCQCTGSLILYQRLMTRRNDEVQRRDASASPRRRSRRPDSRPDLTADTDASFQLVPWFFSAFNDH